MRGLALVLLLLVACNDSPLTVRFRVTPGHEGACFDAAGQQVTECEDVTMSCDVVVSIRIFSPNDPSSPVISVCRQPIGDRNLCSISSIDLPPPNYQIDEQTLEVEMLVYQAKKIPKAADNTLLCPANVMFDAQGFPIASVEPCVGDGTCDPTPAIGGVAFYHPGDTETVVDLGCIDFPQLDDPTCTGAQTTAVIATVSDFDTQVTVASSVADRLTVSVGEPKPVIVGTDPEPHYQLSQSLGEVRLLRSPATQIPAWTGNVSSDVDPLCTEVSEDVAQSTASVRCMNNPDTPQQLSVTGTRLSRDALDDVLVAIGSPGSFPEQGLVVGRVLDFLGSPMANVQVSTDSPTAIVEYLNHDRDGLITTGTSDNGMFISRNAPFGTTFNAIAANSVEPQLGGLIDNKVTVVILQATMQTGN